MKNLILFFLASITVIPIVVYCIYYKVQHDKDSRYTFWNTPEKEAYILERDAKEVLNQPSYEGISAPA